MTTTTNPDFRAREALRLIGPDPENWVSDRPGIDHLVVNFAIMWLACASLISMLIKIE